MGRLSAYAKNRILKLRFKKNKRIIHIVDILKKDDNIKVSRQAVSTFLKKYLETNSIYDKPRTGRKRKLTQEEIQLIGQVTRLNRDITARAIKEYLNLNVSTYTILRATKLFEWNKVNPNSNDSKKAAALERQLNGETPTPGTPASGKRNRSESTSSNKKSKRKLSTNTSTTNDESVNNPNETSIVQTNDELTDNDEHEKETINLNNSNNNTDNNDTSSTADITEIERIQEKLLNCSENKQETTATVKKPHKNANSIPDFEKVDLNLIPHKELAILKNLSCSPMSFATKILFKIFKIEELHGHNVSGKTLNKNLKAKLPLDPVRIGYIKFLVEKYYDEKECKEMLSGANTHKQDLWKSCHTAINKSILISERKAASGKSAIPNNDLAGNFSDFYTSKTDGDEENDPEENNTKKSKTNNKKTKNKSKYDFNSDSSSDSDGEIVIPKKYLNKAGQKNKRNAANAANTGSAKKRNKRFNSSSSTSSSDFDDDLESEEIDSDHNLDGSIDEENEESKNMKKVTNLLKGKIKEEETQLNQSRRRSQRQRKPTYKNTEGNNLITDDEDDDEGVKYNDEDEDNQNEIELIQNIENRLATNNSSNSKTTSPIVTSSSSTSNSLKLPIIKSPPSQNTVTAKAKNNSTTNNQSEDDNEESAAANIAAAMKKRFVVVQPSTLMQSNTSLQETTSNEQPASALKSPNLTPSVNKQENKKQVNKNKETSSQIQTRQLPKRSKSVNSPAPITNTKQTTKSDNRADSNKKNTSLTQKPLKKELDESTSERRTTRSSTKK
jgi:transposase